MVLRHCLQCLDGALRLAGVEGTVVVVDNGTHPPYHPVDLACGNRHVLTVRFDLPVSFSRANNHAARLQAWDHLLLLNNDVFLDRAAVAAMLELTARTPNAGICGSRLLFPDGSIQHHGVVFGPGDTGPYHCDRRRPGHLVSRGDREYQAVSGACMLVSAPLWNDLGGFDEGYAFGLEDIDLCLRARRRGWRVVCSSAVDSLHFESLTPGRVELDVPSRARFMARWRGHYTIDG